MPSIGRITSSFYKDHPDKLTAISKAIDIASLMARPTIRSTAPKQKKGQPVNSTNKRAKKNWAVFGFCRVFGLFKVQVIHALKFLAWKSCDFLTNPLIKILLIEISIFWASTLPLRPTPLNCNLTYKASVFLLSTLTGLGGFLLTIFLSTTLLMIFWFSFSVFQLG